MLNNKIICSERSYGEDQASGVMPEAYVAEPASWLRCVNVDDLYGGYLTSIFFDPWIMQNGGGKNVEVTFPDFSRKIKPPSGIRIIRTLTGQKEKISWGTFSTIGFHNSGKFYQAEFSGAWQTFARLAEIPAVAYGRGKVFFTFCPFDLLKKYLNQAEPEVSFSIISLIVNAVLLASGKKAADENDNRELRRDFHALGVSYYLFGKLRNMLDMDFQEERFLTRVRKAAAAFVTENYVLAQLLLKECFLLLESARRSAIPALVYLLHIPHGGILFESEGFAEYDWPEAAVKVLRLYIHWVERYNYRFAPDIGAGTLKNLARLYPETIARLKKLWHDGKIEFVNGTYSQPYLQLWPEWDQRQNFEHGLDAFTELFGRRPVTYAAQEIALHPALPDILNDFGYRYAVHRCQNLGSVSVDSAPLIDWRGGNSSILALPSHLEGMDKLGSSNYRQIHELLAAAKNKQLPFLAVTDFNDQTSIGIYKEELVRTSAYCELWGRFTTPAEMFSELERRHNPVPRYYNLDSYNYDLRIKEGNYHRYESGGFASTHAYWNQVSEKLQESSGNNSAQNRKELIRLLEGEAHDTYILPYFKTGAFMEIYYPDYCGPRYMVRDDCPRGVKRFIRNVTGLPETISDYPQELPETASVNGNIIETGTLKAIISKEDGCVGSINGKNCSLGKLTYGAAGFERVRFSKESNVLVLSGVLPGFGEVSVKYFIRGNRLFGIITATKPFPAWDSRTPYWDNCVCLSHAKTRNTEIIRTVCGISEKTELEEFFSLDRIVLTQPESSLTLLHGGNIFFKQSKDQLMNRLWCYNETSRSFWWGIALEEMTSGVREIKF